jgi:hypothetical protein
MMALRRRLRTRRGQSLVEFALILPLFLILLLGILDLGRGVAAYNSVANAARSAARVAIVDQNPDAVRQAAVDEAVGLVPLTVVFDPNMNNDEPCRIAECTVRVEVAYEYVPATPIISNIVDTIRVSSASHLPIERLYTSP